MPQGQGQAEQPILPEYSCTETYNEQTGRSCAGIGGRHQPVRGDRKCGEPSRRGLAAHAMSGSRFVPAGVNKRKSLAAPIEALWTSTARQPWDHGSAQGFVTAAVLEPIDRLLPLNPWRRNFSRWCRSNLICACKPCCRPKRAMRSRVVSPTMP